MDGWEKAPGLIQEEVRRAFAKRATGDNSGYDELKEVYAPKNDVKDEPSSTTIKNYTVALLGNVSVLNKSNSELVHLILKSEWLGRQEDYIAVYVRLLANLVSAHGIFLGDTMRMLVDNLTAKPPSNGRISNLSAVSRSTIYARAHHAIQYLLQLIPAAGRVLSNALISTFPHETDSRRAHVVYVQNLLKLAVYAPQLRGEILTLITDRLVKIDVQVQVDLEDLAEDVGDGLVEGIPQVRPDLLEDVEDSESSEEDSESDDDEAEKDARRTKYIIENVQKMDVILDILFSHYDQVFTKASIEDRVGSIDILLSQFMTIILPTHRSRHTQFLLFHFAQKSPTHIDTFIGTCVQMTFDRKQTAMARQASAAYLASFVARGIHVPSNVVRDVFDYLGDELERLRIDYEPSCHGPDLRRYSSFYVLVQALLYIFCYRWRDLETNPGDDSEDDDLVSTYGHHHQWRSGVRESLSQNIFSKLNPLKVCSPAIVTEFARIANHLGVVYVYHLLATNKRIRVVQFASSAYGPNRETALSAKSDESLQHLDAYFPFDPYHLPKSKRWIEGDYREWQGIPGLDDGQGSGSESDDEEAAESDVEPGTETDETG